MLFDATTRQDQVAADEALEGNRTTVLGCTVLYFTFPLDEWVVKFKQAS